MILWEEGRGDLGVMLIQGVGLHEKIQDGGDDGEGSCVGGDVHSRHVRVVENQRHAEVANVAILIRASHVLIIFAEGLAMVSDDND